MNNSAEARVDEDSAAQDLPLILRLRRKEAALPHATDDVATMDAIDGDKVSDANCLAVVVMHPKPIATNQNAQSGMGGVCGEGLQQPSAVGSNYHLVNCNN
jgi:hypothetical protein